VGGAVNYEKLQRRCDRLERARNALERREDELHDELRPILVGYLGKSAIGAGVRKVNAFATHVELVYGYGWNEREYSVTFSRALIESNDPAQAAAEQKAADAREAEAERREQRIADLQRELNSLVSRRD
jgi:hypothetical protein